MKIRAYYDYHDGLQVPLWLVVNFEEDEIDWSKETLYFNLEAPFEMLHAEDILDDTPGITVELGDLVLNKKEPGKIGIYLPGISKRNHILDSLAEVSQLIIRFVDIEEIMQLDNFIVSE